MQGVASSMEHKVPVTALADFEAEDPLELTIAQGEELHIFTTPAPEGWLNAENKHGNKGLVPESYVAPMDPPAGEDQGDDYDDDIRDGDSPMMFSGFMPMGSGRMLADFTAEAEGEMSCAAGDEIELLRPREGLPEGWLYARMGSQQGLVPETYVEVCLRWASSRAAPLRAAPPAAWPRRPPWAWVLC